MKPCLRCGTENPGAANFCMRCGAPLGVRGGDERKVVTVLFCDLVDFTGWAERHDPEEVHATLRAYHAEVVRRIEHHGGSVEKFIGDAVLGLFGVPAAHEDDPERAVRAALRVLDAIRSLNEQQGLDLHVRIGVNTGEAIVSKTRGEQLGGSIAGDVVNTGSRLQAAAPVDGVLVGESTFRATAHVFVYEQRDDVVAKGKAEPLAVWQPIRARSRIGVDLRERPTTPFIGRTAETALLRQVFGSATRAPGSSPRTDRSIPVVLVTGEAGVGKSRLIREFSEYLDELPDLVRWRVGRCLPYGEGVRFWALGEIVKAEAGILDTDDLDVTRTKLEESLIGLRLPDDEREWMSSMLGPLVGLAGNGPSPPRHEVFAAWRAFCAALAADAPTILVLEDLHWADEALLAFLTSLAMRVEGVPLMVVCVARPELADRHPDWDAPLPNLVRISLPPLDEAESRGLLDALLDGARLDPVTERALMERAGGNPLFAEEFVHMLRDRGELADPRRGSIPVPRSLEALVVARLDALPPELKALVQDASVLGKVFWPGGAAAVAAVDRDDVEARLPFLLRRELVRTVDGSTVPGEVEFAFRHDVIVEVAYAQIPKRERADKHRRAAAWIRATVGERAIDFAEEVAHHLQRALDLGRADDPGLRRDAGRAMILAAERAAPLDAAAAAAYLDRALALLDDGDAAKLDALTLAASIAGSMGRFSVEERLYREALAGRRATGDDLAVGELTAMLARSVMLQGRLDEADDLFEDAVATLEAHPQSPALARVYSRIAGQRFVAGAYAEARDWAERALALTGDRNEPADAVVLALQYRGSARAELGDPEGLEDMRAASRLAKRANLTEEAGVALTNLAYLVWMREGPAASLQIALENESFSAQRGFVHNVMWAKAAQIEALFDLGQWDRVLSLADEIVAWDSPEGGVRSTVGMWARVAQAWVLARRGAFDGAIAHVEEIETASQLMGYPEFRSTALAIRAWVAWQRGAVPEALALLDDYAKITEDAADVRVHFLPIAARILVSAGEIDAAEALLPTEPGPPVARRRLSIATAEAVIAEARGDTADAAARYADAANGWEAFGFVLERGQCLVGRGRCLAALGREDEAAATLHAARSVLEPLGAASVLAEIDALLAGRR
ncbi:MAG TPA: adenylate/guanylate cyclase domain-containing protein [Actinomycetota bacterium]|nr:adenylate/guanylate cyclase domain-containing protein [Actinomycetota bacterium]